MKKEQHQPRPVWKRQTARYVVSVDNQAKSSFDSREAAESEARRILDAFPNLAVKVSDSEQDSTTTLGHTQEPDETPE